MNKIVVDTNILFSALLNTNSKIAQMLMSTSWDVTFYTPAYTKIEIFEHEDKIKSIGKLTDKTFLKVLNLVLENVVMIEHTAIPKHFYKTAQSLCQDVDANDSAFVAVTNFVEGILWTGDLKLIKGLKNKGYTNCITTQELYSRFLKQN